MKLFNIKSENGYTLLFAVIVASLMLAIAAFILSVSRKQFILVSSARDSMYAIYAADSGIECAVMNIAAFSSTSTLSNPPSVGIYCNNGSSPSYSPGPSPAASPIPVSFSKSANGTQISSDTTFYLPINTGSAGSCAAVDVNLSSSDNGDTIATTTIESNGYNIGYDSVKDNCDILGPRKVNRALKLTYQ